MGKIFIFFFFFSSFAFSFDDDWTKWEKGEIHSKRIHLNPLRFTNRAQCALDSNKPSESIFLMINNVSVAKGLYRFFKMKGGDAEDLTKKGIFTFRSTIINLFSLIHREIMKGRLPLLPSDSTDKKTPFVYKNLMENCRSDTRCLSLDDYIKSIWQNRLKDKKLAWTDIDNFSFKNHFVLESDFENFDQKSEMYCHYLKKFSPLEAHLFGAKPGQDVFNKMGEALTHVDKHLANCFDFNEQKNLKVAAFQIDIPQLNSKKWKKKGFDYWHSIQLYFSWAIRYAPEVSLYAKELTKLFRSILIEDVVLFIPNGCKTLTSPKCDGDYLALSHLRNFTRKEFKKNALNLDILSPLPEGPSKDLLDDETPKVNTDINDLGEFQSAEKWLENFQDNIAQVKQVHKTKILKALTKLNLLYKNLDLNFLKSEIKEAFNFSKSKNTLTEYNLFLKNQLYYLCGEFTLSGHNDFSFIKGLLKILEDSGFINEISKNFVDENIQTYFSFYEKISEIIGHQCNSIDQHAFWDDEFLLKKEGFFQWYLDKVYDGRMLSKISLDLDFYLKYRKPLIVYPQYNVSGNKSDIICASAIFCSRDILKSIVDLYAATEYTNTFWSFENKVKSPALFNPYAERTACRVYDPWFKTKATLFSFFHDVAKASVSAVAPAAIFASATLKEGRVVSFKQLVNEGKIVYDVNYKKEKIQAGLFADFGPLLGVPCMISLAKFPLIRPSFFHFKGIQVGACSTKNSYDLNVQSASRDQNNDSNTKSACLSCSINFESVATTASYFTPYLGSVFFFIRGIVRLYRGLKDPLNIPRSWETRHQDVLDAYRKYGEISKSCSRKLRKLKSCLKNSCEEDLAKVLHLKKIEGQISSILIDGDESFVKMTPLDKVYSFSCSEIEKTLKPLE